MYQFEGTCSDGLPVSQSVWFMSMQCNQSVANAAQQCENSFFFYRCLYFLGNFNLVPQRPFLFKKKWHVAEKKLLKCARSHGHWLKHSIIIIICKDMIYPIIWHNYKVFAYGSLISSSQSNSFRRFARNEVRMLQMCHVIDFHLRLFFVIFWMTNYSL